MVFAPAKHATVMLKFGSFTTFPVHEFLKFLNHFCSRLVAKVFLVVTRTFAVSTRTPYQCPRNDSECNGISKYRYICEDNFNIIVVNFEGEASTML